MRVESELILLLFLLLKQTFGLSFNFTNFEAAGKIFQQIAIDPKTGNLFLGARNHLYVLSADFHPKESSATQCKLGANNCGVGDNNVKVLEPLPLGGGFLFCGSILNGLCSIYNATNLHLDALLSTKVASNYLASRTGSTVAFFSESDRSRGHRVLYSAATHDGRNLRSAIPAISARIIETNPRTRRRSINYKFNARYQHSYLDFNRKYKESHIVDYIYSFEHEGFTYYLTVQKHPITPVYVTKLVRVCQNDGRFWSYTEIRVICRNSEQHTTTMNIALSASLKKPGAKLRAAKGLKNEKARNFSHFLSFLLYYLLFLSKICRIESLNRCLLNPILATSTTNA